MTPAEFAEPAANYAFNVSTLLVHVLKQCGDDLSRENIMRQAGNINDFELPLLLPGIKVNTSPDNFRTSGSCSSRGSTARTGRFSAV
jgi:branched-chain amino acid transport system substrate-binding protein